MTQEKPTHAMHNGADHRDHGRSSHTEESTWKLVVEHGNSPTMIVDRDLVITYLNKATHDLFASSVDEFRKIWPSFDPDHLVGECIDQFHTHPERQRKLLGDPRNLPFQTDIRVGPLTVELNVRAHFDAKGEHIGSILEWSEATQARGLRATSDALSRSQAVIEFTLDGTVLSANDNFLATLGYSMEEIQGRHHRMFVDPDVAAGSEYRRFWEQLGAGEYISGEFRRIAKDGSDVWIQASYNPILDLNGRPVKVIKFAADITAQKQQNLNYEGQIEAVGKAQAVIEFNLDGTVIEANQNFLSTLGYTIDEIRGQHHRKFVEPEYGESDEYRSFWNKLASGEYIAGEFKRVGKGGRDVWIQASYNPILDLQGKPFKVVKYATDVTEQVLDRDRLESGVDVLLKATTAASAGDLTMEVALDGDDPVGRMGSSLSALLNSLRSSIAAIGGHSIALAGSSEALSEVSQQMAANAEETAVQAKTVSGAAKQVSENIQNVAAGTEEMNASIREIATNASEASQVAGSAVEVAESANTTVSKLGDSSAEIGQVIKVITSIAQQTNLLALNATIEAARAGEAGKGFAVVANEVKELAKETAKATEDISQKIETIQGDTKHAVEAIGEIGTIINRINEIQTTIAAAVEEQSATTMEIGRSVSDAAKGAEEIAENISGVASASEDTTRGATDINKSASELAEVAAQLQHTVGQFKYEESGHN